MTEYYFEEMNGVKLVNFSNFPKELEGLWFSLHKFKDNSLLYAVVSIYKNNRHPSGTIIETPFMHNDYPDAYAIYLHENQEGIVISTRIYTNPEYRGSGWWKLLFGFLRDFLYTNFDMHTDSTGERTVAVERIYKYAKDMVNQEDYTKNDGRINVPEILPPRDPCHPDTWYNHRIGGKNESN